MHWGLYGNWYFSIRETKTKNKIKFNFILVKKYEMGFYGDGDFSMEHVEFLWKVEMGAMRSPWEMGKSLWEMVMETMGECVGRELLPFNRCTYLN